MNNDSFKEESRKKERPDSRSLDAFIPKETDFWRPDFLKNWRFELRALILQGESTFRAREVASGGLKMANDAKLGLVVGVGVVIAVAVVFFRRDAAAALPSSG